MCNDRPMIVTRAELEASLTALRDEISDPRGGILGPRSVAWRIGGDLGLFLGGGRAAMLQLAHPMVAYAIDHHSRTRSDVLGRFQRTFRNVFAMTFGDLDDAFRAARRVHAIHTRVHGEIAESIGGWPAGTTYHANDVDALRWVHATLVDTTLVVRELLDGEQPLAIKDAFVTELNRFARLFGIPRALLPDGFAAHEAYMRAMLASDRIVAAPCAREMARFLIGRGDPAVRQPPLGRVVESLTAMLLPRHLAAQFGLRPTPVRARASIEAFGAVYRRIPHALRGIPARSEAHRRLAGLPPSRVAAWTERQLFGLAQRVTS